LQRPAGRLRVQWPATMTSRNASKIFFYFDLT
jgi:hypothetical protein